MMFSALNDVPPSHMPMFGIAKGHEALLYGENHLRRTKRGILAPYNVGNWSAAKGVTIELHKFWFCHDD